MHSLPITVSSVVHSQKTNQLSMPMQLRCGTQDIDIHALIDTGAEGTFIHHRIVQHYDLPTRRLHNPINVQNVDGTHNRAGQITHEVRCWVTIDGRTTREQLLITNTGSSEIILGLPWLQQVNPNVNFAQGTFEFPDKRPLSDTRKLKL